MDAQSITAKIKGLASIAREPSLFLWKASTAILARKHQLQTDQLLLTFSDAIQAKMGKAIYEGAIAASTTQTDGLPCNHVICREDKTLVTR